MSVDWGVEFGTPKIDVNKVRARKDKVIETLTGGLAQLAKRRNVKIVKAHGKFENSTTLLLEGDDPSIPEDRRITFDFCVVATGSVPAMPPSFDIGSSRVMDSTGALALADIPEKLLVIGGGYIGLEMGTVYAHQTPSGTPMPAPRMMPSVASSIVAGKVRLMSCITGLDVSTEVPKSPCRTLFM